MTVIAGRGPPGNPAVGAAPPPADAQVGPVAAAAQRPAQHHAEEHMKGSMLESLPHSFLPPRWLSVQVPGIACVCLSLADDFKMTVYPFLLTQTGQPFPVLHEEGRGLPGDEDQREGVCCLLKYFQRLVMVQARVNNWWSRSEFGNCGNRSPFVRFAMPCKKQIDETKQRVEMTLER